MQASKSLMVRERRALTAGLIMVMTMIAFEAMAVATALPVAEKHLGDVRLYGWTFSAFLLAQIAGAAMVGTLVDRSGLAGPAGVGLALFATGLAMGAGAPTMEFLVVSRTVQGLGAGAVSVAGFIAVSRAYPREIRPRMMAWLSSAWVVPALAGPALAGIVAERASWRLVFAGIIPFAFMAGAITLPSLVRSDRSTRAASTPRSSLVRQGGRTALLVIGLAVLLGGVDLKNIPLAVSLTAVGGTSGIYGMIGLVPGEAGRTVERLVLLKGFLLFSFLGVESLLPLTLVDLDHQSPIRAGLVLTVSAVAWTTTSWLQSHVRFRLSRRAAIVAGFLTIGIGDCGILALLHRGTPYWIALIAWAVCGLGVGLAYPSVTLEAIGSTEGDGDGAAISAFQTAETVGGALATGLGAAALSWSVSGHHGLAPGIGTTDVIGIGGTVIAAVLAISMPALSPPRA